MTTLEALLDDYYAEADLFDFPAMSRREFAFQAWDGIGPNDRHHCFPSTDVLRSIIRIKKPKAVFASNARYLDPGHPKMDKKTHTGVDLAFDFDFGDLPEHELGSGFWENMDAVAVHVRRLLGQALPALGLNPDDAIISFSGGKGFHVRLVTDEVLPLTRDQRRNIQDFVRGNNLSHYHVFARGKKSGKYAPRFEPSTEGGWPGHYAASAKVYFQTIHDSPKSVAVEFVKANLPLHTSGEKKGQKKNPTEGTMKEIVDIIQSKSSVLNGGVLSRFFPKKKQMTLVRDSIARFAVLNNGCAIDLSVTGEIRRILRVPGSIHGKTGLPCMLLSPDELDAQSIKAKVESIVGSDLVEVELPHLVQTPFGVYEKGVQTLPRFEALSALATVAHEEN